MISEFTFISVCYNQENFMIGHLDSIKEQITQYGENIKVSLILADDNSRDRTVLLAKEWIDKNGKIFENVLIIENKYNVGTVKNIYNAIERCKTDYFKILACDDSYNEKTNIFDIYNHHPNDIVITPIVPILNESNENRKYLIAIERDFKLVQYYVKRNKLDVLLSVRNYLMAPGVFIPCKYWRDNDIKKEILQFKYVEDYPMWVNLFIKRRSKALFLTERYVKYRVSVSSRKIDNKSVNDVRKNDYIKLKKMYCFDLKSFEKMKYVLCKIFFTYRIIFKELLKH